MEQILLKKGTIYTADVPDPVPCKDMILVKTSFSCISAGTEMAGVKSSGSPLVRKVMEHPEYVSRGIRMLGERGLRDTWDAVRGKDGPGTPMGYSASGIVVESGTDAFMPGDRVACMGVGYANHAGCLVVPRNLAAKVPEQVSLEHASTAALGCIAMQGIRRADVKLGEYVVIAGMGILGQLACRFAAACGATVIVTDTDGRRLGIARKGGAEYAVSAEEDTVKEVLQITGGHGADSVIITASTQSDALVSQAFRMCRKKGRVVLVGVAGMNLKREDMYQKELDFVISTSYGPGRYDTGYEEKGTDYPYGYVRFTEKRNLESYLRLLAAGRVDITDIIEGIYPAKDADAAYASLKNTGDRPLAVLLRYTEGERTEKSSTVSAVPGSYTAPEGRIRVAVCGAGGFARGMHIPNLKKMQDKYTVYAVQSRTGSNAQAAAAACHAKYSATDYRKILEDKDVDMVMVCTRHNLHAQMAIDAMEAGKAVFVEKPAAVTPEEMARVMEAARRTQAPFMVGFNRRFSRYAQEAKRVTAGRKNPMIVSYRMNAGYLPPEHWTQTEEGGGRIIGEGCHIFDLFNFFTESRAESVSVNRITPKTDHVSSSDNVVVTVKYKDGSVCTLTYTGQGNEGYGKEFCEIMVDGMVVTIDDYKSIKGYGVKVKDIRSAVPMKGQYEELLAFYKAVKGKKKYPVPLWQLEQAMGISFLADQG